MSEHGLVPQHDAVNKSSERLKENIKRPWGLYGIDTGHHGLNLLMGGWIPGKLTTIAARSGIGKTAMSTQFLQRGGMIVNGRRAHFLFMSWEMESSYIVDRHVQNRVRITNRLLTQGARLLPKKVLAEIGEAYAEAKQLPVLYQEMSINLEVASSIIRSFSEKCREMEQAEGIRVQPVIVIDYIQMAKFDNQTRTYGIGDYINALKGLANEIDGSVCVFGQLRRSSDNKTMPERNDVADSGAIENASDNMIFLHRPEYYHEDTMEDPRQKGEEIDAENKLLLRALKGRDFGIGDMLTECEIKYCRFWHPDQGHFDYPYYNWYEDESYWKRLFGFEGVDENGQIEIL